MIIDMSSLAALTYPKKSHRKTVILPRYSESLAEFFGIMMGDGGINNPWQANITLNSIKDASYARYVQELISKLFSITPALIVSKTKDALRIHINSISIVEFLVQNGLVRGDKLKGGLRIPEWILHNKDYKIFCVRGLVDTDGCVFIHTHTVAKKKYRNIGLTFSSRSLELISQVAGVFEEFGIIPHISKRGWDIYLYKQAAVEQYLRIFGTSNERIISVYEDWKRGRAVEGARLESV